MRKGRKFLAGICALALTFSFTPVGGYLPGDAGVEEVKAETSGDWEYEVLEDGTVEITRYTGTSKELTIPETIVGKKVTRIGDYAFENRDNLTSIIIPEGVESIEYSTFRSCDNLKSVTIPGSVKTISESAFSDSNKLSEIIINEKNKVYSSIDGNLYDKAQTKLIRYAAGKTNLSFNIPGSVTSIGDNAFEACVSLSSVTIPGSARNIGDYAFRDCINLASITIPGSVTNIGSGAFEDCVKLTSVTIPGSVTNIGSGAFRACVNLTSVIIPESVKSIGGYTFERCTSLSSITIPKGVTSIGDYAFSGCARLDSITIPGSVTSIGRFAFSYCTDLTSVTIPRGLTSIESHVFFGCIRLGSVTIPESVKSIGDYAFANCTSLISVDIPRNVTSIGALTFKDCISLTSITILESITSIGVNAFANCSRLSNIAVSEKNKVYSSKDGNLYDKAQTKLIRYAAGKTDTSFNIPGTVTSIEDGAFYGCTNLTSVIIPESITSIEDGAFYNCAGLTSVIIPKSVTSIGDYVFQNCISLISIIIPENVTKIGYDTFSGCTDLTSVTIPKSITEIGTGAFSSCASLTSVIIPEGVTSIGSSTFSGCISLSSVTIPKSITEIGSYTFSGCTNLTSVTIPESVTTIGDSAFEGCINLTSVNIPGSVTSIENDVFANCSKLREIRVNEKNKVYTSEDGNLYDKAQTRLIQYAVGKAAASFVIPGSVKEIGSKAFSGCTSLTSVTIPKGVTKIERDAFSGCTSLISVTIPEGVTEIGYKAFSDCTGLTSVNIPESVINIEGTPFANCSKLKEITVNEKNKVYSSKDGNLYDKAQTRLIQYAIGKSDTSFIVPRSVTIIENGACSGCAALTSVTIPESVISIEYGAVDAEFDGAFANCSSLKEIIVDENNKFYSSKDGNLYDKAQNNLIQYAIGKPDSSFIIPEGVISFSYCAFSGCDSLVSITMPASFTYLAETVEPQSPLYRCSNLKEIIVDEKNKYYSSKDGNLYNKTQKYLIQYAVGKTDPTFTVPDGVELLGYYAFTGCTHLTSITIPRSVTEILGIRGDIFAGCKNILIKGYKNSHAQIYAKQHNIKFIALDDRESYKVTFNSAGGSAVAAQTVAEGETAAKPADPTKKGYTFAGWYNGSTRYDFNSLIMGNLTLTAKWTYQCSTPSISKAENANGGVKLTWNKVTGAVKYRIFYKKNGKWTKIADTTGTSYTWKGAASGTSYIFTVRCVSSDGSYYTSNYNTSGKSIRYIAAPVISKIENTNGGVKLTWGKVSGAAKYRVFYKKNGKWTKIADTTGTGYTWKGAKSGTKYTFTVRCVSSDGKTFTSGYNAAGKSIRYLAQPEIKKFEVNNSGLKITWGKVTGAAKYRVYYKTAKGWKQLRETSGTSCTINATLGKSYTYTVRAFNGSDSSTYNKTGKAFKRVATPKLSGAINVKGGVKISWGRVSGAQKYRVFYKKNGKWTKLTDTTSTSYTWKKAKKGTTYTFTVRCINSNASAYTSGYNTAGKKVKYNGK